MGGQENAKVALMGDLLDVREKLLGPAGVDAVVDLLDDKDGSFWDREESRGHRQHAQCAVREKGCFPRYCSSPLQEAMLWLNSGWASELGNFRRKL